MKAHLAHLLQSVAGSAPGRRAGALAYTALARVVAAHLVRVPDVLAVYATGSLLGVDTLAPGQSDIDLSVILQADSPEREVATRLALADTHRHLLRLGPMFHGIDPMTIDVLPLQRAFGTASAIELDRHGLCLAGVPVWSSPAVRPLRELSLERFTQAARRWVNGSGLLLDPRVQLAPAARLRSAGKLLRDVGFAWIGTSRHRPMDALARDLEARGTSVAWARGPASAELMLGAALDVLGRFARELLPRGHPFSPSLKEPGPPSAPALDRLAGVLLGGPLVTLTAYRRAPSLDDWVPVANASSDAEPAAAVQVLGERLLRHRAEVAALGPSFRRPVVLPSAVWSAAAFLDPAPFAGAAATRASSWGAPLPEIFAPAAEDLASLVRARTTESYTLLSILGFRGRPDPARLARDADRRHGRLVPALRAALSTGSLDTGRGLEPGPVPAGPADHVAAMHRWRAETAEILRPLLGRRLP